EDFARARARLPAGIGPLVMALAPEADVHAALVRARQTRLARKAETRVAAAESCRSLDGARGGRRALALLGALTVAALAAPVAVFSLLAGWAIVTLIAFTGLKLAAFCAEARHRHRRFPPRGRTTLDRARPDPSGPDPSGPDPSGPDPAAVAIARLPVVSVLVPLLHEDDIAPRLIRRLGRIDYPKELFDVLLLVEEEDHATRAALARHRLPRWMRVVTVPAGPIRTKPRALNYGLDFCRGSIIGVYDAEDAPEAGQIHRIVRRFHERGPEVACLQGILDYYNARHNWLSRCFTIEYAAWFRAMLPGLARLGLVVPLGGTTLFFRRSVLEELGGWDAHNVTEDADLGLRLARRGYRTELVDTVTEEEPNARLLPWIRQRSRWQKGFWMTWASHMRDPGQLLRDLGAWRFFGVQVLFLGSLSQAVLAPVLWSFWLLAFGLPHPLRAVLPEAALSALVGLFVLSETVSILVGIWAVRGPGHRHLGIWVPTLHLYHPLAAIASWKALYEAVTRPFYWDKTTHGLVDRAEAGAGDGDLAVDAVRPTDRTAEAAAPALAAVDSALPRSGGAAGGAEGHAAGGRADGAAGAGRGAQTALASP
ncbi:MAG: glycosyl transferase, partial [Alphaproteobacteria bacterium HGW-Alphaproteobacteria-6]